MAAFNRRPSRRGHLLSLLVLTAACGTLVGNPVEDNKGGQGTGGSTPPALSIKSPVTIAITDAPVDDLAHVYITVTELSMIKADGGLVHLPLQQAEEFDLLALQGGDKLSLSSAEELEVGSYQGLRLVLSDSKLPRVVDLFGGEEQLKVPSNELRVDAAIEHVAGEALALTLDFDLRKSLRYVGDGQGASDADKGQGKGHAKHDGEHPGQGKGSPGESAKAGEPGGQGRYILRPHLRLAHDKKSGGIAGNAEDARVVCIYAAGTAKDEDDSCAGALTTAKVKGGRWRAAYLPEGEYDIRILGGASAKDRDKIKVKAGEDTEQGDVD